MYDVIKDIIYLLCMIIIFIKIGYQQDKEIKKLKAAVTKIELNNLHDTKKILNHINNILVVLELHKSNKNEGVINSTIIQHENMNQVIDHRINVINQVLNNIET